MKLKEVHNQTREINSNLSGWKFIDGGFSGHFEYNSKQGIVLSVENLDGQKMLFSLKNVQTLKDFINTLDLT